MFYFDRKYFILTVILLLIEIAIALFVHDRFIRPFVGDFLVVILMYCSLKSFWKASPRMIALSVLAFAFVVEFLQYFDFLSLVGLKENRLARIIFGNTFSTLDLVAYTFGIGLILIIENQKKDDKPKH